MLSTYEVYLASEHSGGEPAVKLGTVAEASPTNAIAHFASKLSHRKRIVESTYFGFSFLDSNGNLWDVWAQPQDLNPKART